MWETPKIPKQIVLTGSSWRNQWFFGCPMPKSWQIGWFRFKLATCRTAWARQAVIARFVSLPIFILQAQNRLRPSREFSCVVFFFKCASHVFHSARSAYSCLRPQCGCGLCSFWLWCLAPQSHESWAYQEADSVWQWQIGIAMVSLPALNVITRNCWSS